MFTESVQTGTFLYTFAGAGATASYVIGNILEIPGIGSTCCVLSSFCPPSSPKLQVPCRLVRHTQWASHLRSWYRW